MPTLTRVLRCADILVATAVALLVLWSRYYALLACSWTGPASNMTQIEARVLFFADPQIEGDAKIWRHGTKGRIELALNDAFHRVVAAATARLRPTHAVLLGDLFSSERVNDTEFAARVRRFAWSFAPVLRAVPTINITGNHDIGYGAAVVPAHLRAFERVYGAAGGPHALGGHVFCAVNSQVLEGAPAALVAEAWARVADCAAAAAAARAPVVLLTHIPLHNNGPDGAQPACDAYSVAWTADTPPAIREQTHLTPATSARLLAALRPALVFAGHDHRGCAYRVVYCDTTTNTSGSSTSGNSTNSSSGASVGERRVVQQWTVRSVMGEHRGNAQLLAIGRRDDGAFAYAVSSCALGLKMVHYVWAAVAVGVYVGARVLLVCVPACVRTRRHRGCAAATKHKSD